MNELQIFNNPEFGETRIVDIEGEPWWVLADVCRVLNIERADSAARRLDSDEKGTHLVSTLGGTQNMTIINESGLYKVLLRSDKPEAKKFTRWVTSEVLPTIRKTGGYVNNDEMFINTYLPHADEGAKAIFRQTLQTLRAANEQIERDRPKVVFADAVAASKTSILIGDLAKLMRQNGVHMGQNRLFSWMREKGYLIRRNGSDYNLPTQRSMEMGLFEIKETAISHSDGHTSINKTTKVTGKGQQYFINLFLG